MTKILSAFFLLMSIVGITQTNDTQIDRYAWSKKGTDPQPGYVVLKSGKRMDGTIQLKGTRDNIQQVVLVKDGREMELELGSLKSFGLTGGELTNDSPEEMYEWRDGATSTSASGNVTVRSSTKPKRGYLVLNDGRRIEGELRLDKVNGVLDEFVIKNDLEGKQDFKPSLVAHYGLVPSIADITKGGKKVYDEEGKNFTSGTLEMFDSGRKDGMIAFVSCRNIPSSDTKIYSGIYYAPSESEPVTVIQSKAVKSVSQMIGATRVVYVPFEDGFVNETELAGLAITQQFKLFHPGKITTIDKAVLSGSIAQVYEDGKAGSTAVKHKSRDGSINTYPAAEVFGFTVTIEGEEYNYIAVGDVFTELLYEYDAIAYYKNPYPTTVNEKATNIARNVAGIAGSVGSAAAVNSMDGVSEENKEKLSEGIANSSTDQLQEQSQQINELRESELLDEQGQKNATKMQTAMVSQSVGRELANNLTIMNVEYFIWNKVTDERSLIIKSDFEDTMTPVLQGCEEFLLLSKTDQKNLRQKDNIMAALRLLNKCYGGQD